MKILCKFPSRSRPWKFVEVFDLYRTMASGTHEMEFVLTFDADDPTMNNPAMKRLFSSFGPNVHVFFGNSKSKIQAVNADMDRGWDYDILLLASDDMVPVQKDYDRTIVQDMQRHFPDLDGVLHYNDGIRGPQLNTLCIMGKPYYDRFGYIYNPAYESVYCDNEFTEVSQTLGKSVYIDNIIIRHKWMEGGKDALYSRNEDPALYHRDYHVYLDRKQRRFA